MEASLGRPLPDDLKRLYAYANGVSLFSVHLTIWGWITKIYRTGDKAIQPYALDSHNIPAERFEACPDEFLFFGSCACSCDRLAFPRPSRSREVWRVGRRTGKRRGSWPNLWAWLSRETERLARLFDAQGRPLATDEEMWGDPGADA